MQPRLERPTTPEGMVRSLSADLRDARRLLARTLSDAEGRGRAREREGGRERETSRELEANQRQLTLLLENAERTTRELDEALGRQRVPPRGYPDRATLSDRQFNDIVLTVRRSRSGGEQLRLVRELAQREWVTTRQVRSLLLVVESPRDQEELAALLYRRLTDPERFSSLRDALVSKSSWEGILSRLGMR